MPKILILFGPNLNVIGIREPEIYGHTTHAQLVENCTQKGRELGLEVTCRQSNFEGELVTWIPESRGQFDGIVINAGAYTHTSIAILDALKFAELPVFEVHMSNIFARESYRHHSYISPVAQGVICGYGANGYLYALQELKERLK